MPISLVLADDHPIVLEGLVQLFSMEQDCSVLARCTNGTEALQTVRTQRPDILILDIRMPEKDGLTVFREMQEEQLSTRVVILSAALDDEDVFEAIQLGAHGVVLKEMAPQLLVQCVRTVFAGGVWLEKDSVSRALEKIKRREAGSREVSGMLTPREIEIMCMVASGLRNKEIAQRLSLSEGTIKVHLHHTYEKLQINGRVELTLFAQNKGLV